VIASHIAFGWIALAVACALCLLLLRMRRRRALRRPSGPSATINVPCLKSADGRVYFRLVALDSKGYTIGRGRHDVDFSLPATLPGIHTVSDQHARIYRDALCGAVVIEDLGSRSGVYINGRRAPRKTLLRDGWTVRLGSVQLTYRDGQEDTGPLN